MWSRCFVFAKWSLLLAVLVPRQNAINVYNMISEHNAEISLQADAHALTVEDNHVSPLTVEVVQVGAPP